jgi:hypothetical protein
MRGKKEDPGVARLAAEGFTATETAQKLGISRQRVYQIAKRDGVVFALRSRVAPVAPDQPRPPRPLVFFGADAILNKVVVGSIAELLVAADLLSRGWQVYTPLVRHRGHDLIACRAGQIITVEVRSTKRFASNGNRLWRNIPSRAFPSSHLAWVITGEPIIYEPPLGDLK